MENKIPFVLHTSPVRLLACTAPLGLSLDSGFHQSEDGGLSKQPAACHFSGSGLGFSIDDGLIHVGSEMTYKKTFDKSHNKI